MGPRPFRRGNPVVPGGVVKIGVRFNGATPFQAWKRVRSYLNCACGKSFNGATPFQAWKRRGCPRGCAFCIVLQWGHALSGVETTRARTVLKPMPWLQWGHALSGVETASLKNRLGLREAGTGAGFFTACQEICPRLSLVSEANRPEFCLFESLFVEETPPCRSLSYFTIFSC